jgi:hypothetical protein
MALEQCHGNMEQLRQYFEDEAKMSLGRNVILRRQQTLTRSDVSVSPLQHHRRRIDKLFLTRRWP